MLCDGELCVLPDSITPIFTLSNVSGESLDLLKVFLNIIPPLSNTKEQEELMEQLTEFQVRLQLKWCKHFQYIFDNNCLHCNQNCPKLQHCNKTLVMKYLKFGKLCKYG